MTIAGAGRNLTKLKQAGELQRLLFNELNHPVKNTFATIQAIIAQTLRASARSGSRPFDLALLDQRQSVRRGHTRAGRFRTHAVADLGHRVDVSRKHALALSLALHELATNASKYGALSGFGAP